MLRGFWSSNSAGARNASLELLAGYQLLRKLSIDADFNLISASYVRGNENNLHQPDGVFFLDLERVQATGLSILGLAIKLTAISNCLAGLITF